MADTDTKEVSLASLLAEKQAAVKRTTLETLATYLLGAQRKTADLTNTFNKQKAGQDKIVAEVNAVNDELDKLSSSDLTIRLNALAQMVAAGGL